MQRHIPILIILALTQVMGWGVVSVLPVLAQTISQSLGSELPQVFIGNSIMFIAMGLCAPPAGKAFRRFGVTKVMGVGAAVIGLGIGAVSLSPAMAFYWVAWGLIGSGGAMFLTTAAYAFLAEFYEETARSSIGALMLATGLAGSVFLPVTAFLDHLLGWRATLGIYAALMALIVCPLVWFGLPKIKPAPISAAEIDDKPTGPVFFLLVSIIALNGFVTFGIEAVGVELMRSMGMSLASAVMVASLLGVFKVGGRLVDVLGGKQWDGLNTALVAGAMIPAGLVAVWLGGAGALSIMGYLLLFGVGSGAFAVARATMPLVFYQKANYAAAMANIALPMNVINALSAPVLAALLGYAGPKLVFMALGCLSFLALLALLKLNALRR